MARIHSVARLLWAYCSLWPPEQLGAPGEEADTWSVSSNMPLINGQYKPGLVYIKLYEIWKWGEKPFSELVVGRFIPLAFLWENLAFWRFWWLKSTVLKLKTYFLGWKCALTVLLGTPGPSCLTFSRFLVAKQTAYSGLAKLPFALI